MKLWTVISIILVVVAILLCVFWYNERSAKEDIILQKDSLAMAFNTALGTINEIQSSIDSIDVGPIGTLLTSDELPRTEGGVKSHIIVRINDIRKAIAADRKRIASLEKQLAASGVKIKGLQDLVENMKASLAEKEQIVTELSGRIGMLEETLQTERLQSQEQMALKETQIAEKQTIIDTKEIELNTIYYAVGSRKDLIEQKVISRTGGFLGIGRVSVVNKGDNQKYTPLNLLQADLITFPADKDKYSILTNQNPDSFIVAKNGNFFELKIINRELFRKSKYLVIEIP